MDLRKLVVVPVVILMVVMIAELGFVSGNFVFKVQHKFAGRKSSLSELKAHDARRHSRILSQVDVDLPLGGNGNPTKAGLYFTKIGLGNPPKDFYVQVDTGSDLLWVGCAHCDKCPTKSDLGVKLTLYDPTSSSSSSRVYCADAFCVATYGGVLQGCKKDLACPYEVVYDDGSSTAGFFVKDNLQFDRVTGNLQTSSANGSVIFGCGVKLSGNLNTPSDALDGIIGFGKSNLTMISQLAATGKVKKMFGHCLDNVNGGGIFAIGEIVSPKVNTTPLVPNQTHYNVVIKEIEVGGNVLELPMDVVDTEDKEGAIIDSGTTLAYLPEVVYKSMITKIVAQQPGLKFHTVEKQPMCFHYNGNVDDGFPVVKFYFEGSLTLTVYPHDYLYHIRKQVWCFGWQNSGTQSNGKNLTILGDLVLSNKLVLYDLENQAIGWTEHNCSSSIEVKDEASGSVYSVAAHNLSS